MARVLSLVAAAGAATLAAAANPHAAMGGYQPATNVIEHSQIVYDIEAIQTALSADDFTEAKNIYMNGKYSCKSTSNMRNLQGFVKQATYDAKLNGTAFVDAFVDGDGPSYGPIPGSGGRLMLSPTFWDDFLLGAFDGTGDFLGMSTAIRKVAINKGVLGVSTLYAAYEMESAIGKKYDDNSADASGAPHAWDEGWAFLCGSHPADDGKYSAWEFSKKRDLDFAYNSSAQAVEGATVATDMLLKYFLHGLRASRSGGVLADMVAARNNIYRMLALSSIRAALKYAEKAQNPYNEEYHMEAYVYFLVAANWVEQAYAGAGTNVLALLDFKKTEAQLPSNLYCAVKTELVPSYQPLGLDCAKVGVLKGHDDTLDDNCNAPACPATQTLPTGLDSYVPDVTTTVGSDVYCPAVTPGGATTTGPSDAGMSGAGLLKAFAPLAWVVMLGATWRA